MVRGEVDERLSVGTSRVLGMTDSNAPEPRFDTTDDANRVETPDDVRGGGAFVDGTGRPEAGMATPDRRGDAPADASGEVIGAGAPQQGAVKDPEDWVTGDEPMTEAQKSYLDTLAREAGETLPADLTKAEASEHIDRLQGVTGRGANS